MDGDGHALPMVAVYLLGHKVGDIEEPVLYVSHQSRDYDNNIVTKGLPNPFVDSLTHDSIIVQIPRLHGHINRPVSGRLQGKKRLDMVLSIFDQTQRDENDNRLLQIDDSAYGKDADMEHILHRLTMAAADADMRHKTQLTEQKDMLRRMVRMLLDAGQSVEMIASSLGQDIETVKRLA